MKKKAWVYLIFITAIFLVLICYYVLPIVQRVYDESVIKADYFSNATLFLKTAEYLIRTEGKVSIDKLRPGNEYGFTEETKGDEYKPSKEEAEAISAILYQLDYRTIYRKSSGEVIIIKKYIGSLEKGLMKISDTKFPPGVVDTEHLEGDWYIYVLGRQ